jgi:hypothetical protein
MNVHGSGIRLGMARTRESSRAGRSRRRRTRSQL